MRAKSERNQLSPREAEVLRLASNGLTDQQIAYALGIRVSTVTTYWVRIRGKVGQLSRAELIASSVRQRSQETVNELRSENARLKDELGQRHSAHIEALQQADVLRASLDALPTGMLIIRPDGGVATTNRSAQHLLGCEARELLGRFLSDLSGVPADLELKPLEGPAHGWTAVLLKPAAD